MNETAHILVVDDDAEIRDLLETYLSDNGYRATAVRDGHGLRAVLEHQQVDLVVLDLMLPGDDGLTLCRELRSHSRVPVLMLTARGDEVDRILGLEMGADDYLPKPFNPRELLARIKSILRRTHQGSQDKDDRGGRRFLFDGWCFDRVTRQLLAPDGASIALSGAEYRLLEILLRHANEVLSRDQLMRHLHGRDSGPFDRSLDVQVSRLRQRLGDDGREPRVIKTVRNRGYVLAVPVIAEP
ncbi:MAG TPA: response regulator [Gammaproteobacteria bacterium]|nr:response regulator [Gammaproteobacteria bacterium]